MVSLIYMSAFVSCTLARGNRYPEQHIILAEVQMNVRRRLHFLNHVMIGSRVSCVSDHFDLSRGEIWGGKNFQGRQNAEDGPPPSLLGYQSEVQGGMSGSILTVDLQNPTWL